MILTSITEFVLYICFSILIGFLILSMIPENKKTAIYIPKKLIYLSSILIPIGAFAPVLQTAIILAYDMDLWLILTNIILTFEIGKAWVFISIITVILLFVLKSKDLSTKMHLKIWALFLVFLMLLGYTRSAHASTITEWSGFLFQTLHFLSVTIWIGILFIVSWFSKDKRNWKQFLKWFTPVAVACLFIAIVTGYFTMEIDIDSYDDPSASITQEYQNSLITNYGQTLLLKHIFIISLVLFALINGIMFRKRYHEKSFNPLIWARMESFYALIVFGLTAFMGQSWPPHQVYNLVRAEGASPLFSALYNGDIVNEMQNAVQNSGFNMTLSLGVENYLLFGMGFLFLILTVYTATYKESVFFTTSFSLLMSISVYMAIMLGVQ